jgi:hypothetical protein
MSTLVTTEFFAQPGRGDDVANLLIEILGESLQHDGCEIIRILPIELFVTRGNPTILLTNF